MIITCRSHIQSAQSPSKVSKPWYFCKAEYFCSLVSMQPYIRNSSLYTVYANNIVLYGFATVTNCKEMQHYLWSRGQQTFDANCISRHPAHPVSSSATEFYFILVSPEFRKILRMSVHGVGLYLQNHELAKLQQFLPIFLKSCTAANSAI